MNKDENFFTLSISAVRRIRLPRNMDNGFPHLWWDKLLRVHIVVRGQIRRWLQIMRQYV